MVLLMAVLMLMGAAMAMGIALGPSMDVETTTPTTAMDESTPLARWAAAMEL